MIVFGRNGSNGVIQYKDAVWAQSVDNAMSNGVLFDKAASYASAAFLFDKEFHYFLNPLVPNFIDDKYADKIYYVDAVTGALTRFSDNPKIMENLKYMGFGEALCDSVEVLP